VDLVVGPIPFCARREHDEPDADVEEVTCNLVASALHVVLPIVRAGRGRSNRRQLLAPADQGGEESGRQAEEKGV